MSTARTLIAWLVVCIAAAGGTILAITVLEPQLGLRSMAANFGSKDTH